MCRERAAAVEELQRYLDRGYRNVKGAASIERQEDWAKFMAAADIDDAGNMGRHRERRKMALGINIRDKVEE